LKVEQWLATLLSGLSERPSWMVSTRSGPRLHAMAAARRSPTAYTLIPRPTVMIVIILFVANGQEV
jgi:hypothetical protein